MEIECNPKKLFLQHPLCGVGPASSEQCVGENEIVIKLN
jgi:hypothetical protein